MDNFSSIVFCKVCNFAFYSEDSNTLVIKNVPESTFDLSDKTIDLNIIDCPNCGAVQLFNTSLSEDYKAVHRSIGNSKEFRKYKKEQLEYFAIKHEIYGKNILEYGCGDGQFFEIFTELGLDVEGIEFGKENYNKCIAKRFKVTNQPSSDLYDVLFCFHVLEHYPDPKTIITEFYNLLSPGGIGLIEVPSYDIIEKNNNWLEFTKDHRLYFRKKTLEYLLLTQGFEVLELQENIDTVCLTAIIRKPKTKDSFIRMKDQIEKDIEKFKNITNGNFSIWGAGHYAQLLLQQLNIRYGIKPEKIFDSNKQKCGGKICDVLVEYKDEVIKYELDKLIIICGIYNNEVEKMLKEMKINVKEIVKWN